MKKWPDKTGDLLRGSIHMDRFVNSTFNIYIFSAIVAVIVWWLDLQIPMQSVPITTKVVNLNAVHGEVYSLQHYVIKFVSDLRPVEGFLQVLWFPPSIKLTATI
jgi:hypothetical protein